MVKRRYKKTGTGRYGGGKIKGHKYKTQMIKQVPNYNIHYFRRKTNSAPGMPNPITLTSAGSYQYINGFTFTLDSLPDGLEYRNMYDHYMLVGVGIHFFPATNCARSGGTNDVGIPRVITAIDRTDTTPTTIDQLRQYANARFRYLDKDIRFYCPYPRTAGQAFRSTLTSGYVMNKPLYVPTTDAITGNASELPHYGVKFGMKADNPAASTVPVWVEWELTYYFKCRRSR